MLFKEVVGQTGIKAVLLQSAKENRVGHAFLFTGNEGSGMLGLAIAFARYLNCENPLEADSCRNCSSCRKYSKMIHPDLHFVFPVTSTKNSGKDPVSDDFLPIWRKSVLENPYMRLFQWYEYMGVENKQGSISRSESIQIIKKLSLKNFEAKYKVMIIWMAEKMNIYAANKLLKILEEPPENTVFILIAEDAGQIIPTILSRTQIIRIPKIDKISMEDAISGLLNVNDKKQATGLVKFADGNYLQAIEAVMDTEQISYNFDMFVRLMRICYKFDITEILSWIDEMAQKGREPQKQFFHYALRLIRGNLILNLKAGDIDLLSDEEKDFSSKFSLFIHPGNVFSICDELNKASAHIEYNGYSRLILFDLALKLVKLLKA